MARNLLHFRPDIHKRSTLQTSPWLFALHLSFSVYYLTLLPVSLLFPALLYLSGPRKRNAWREKRRGGGGLEGRKGASNNRGGGVSSNVALTFSPPKLVHGLHVI